MKELGLGRASDSFASVAVVVDNVVVVVGVAAVASEVH